MTPSFMNVPKSILVFPFSNISNLCELGAQVGFGDTTSKHGPLSPKFSLFKCFSLFLWNWLFLFCSFLFVCFSDFLWKCEFKRYNHRKVNRLASARAQGYPAETAQTCWGVPPPLHAHPAAGPAAPAATLIQVQPKTAQRKEGRLGGALRRAPSCCTRTAKQVWVSWRSSRRCVRPLQTRSQRSFCKAWRVLGLAPPSSPLSPAQLPSRACGLGSHWAPQSRARVGGDFSRTGRLTSGCRCPAVAAGSPAPSPVRQTRRSSPTGPAGPALLHEDARRRQPPE